MRKMMIGNNNLHTELVRTRDLFYFRNTTIDGNQKSSSFFCEYFNRGDIHTVPLVMTMRNIHLHIFISNFFKKIIEDDRARDAVAIIITKNDDLLVGCNRFEYA